jgi:two-component system, cell cycle response regulator DivK
LSKSATTCSIFSERALALLGWETILGENGREAINKLELEYDLPRVVLLDMRTPGMNGIMLAATLKAHPTYENIRIVAASGHAGGLTGEHCLALGCDDFISRPLDLPEVETRLRNILSVQRRKIIRATEPLNLESETYE